MDYQTDLAELVPHTGLAVAPPAIAQLARYATWLVEEAATAGGIGRAEIDRVLDRHVLDALLFAVVWRQLGHSPTRVVDLGSGVGLPGIPLAVVNPGVEVHLVDRSERRIGLAERAVRILELPNVVTHCRQFDQMSPESGSSVVSRASLPPADLLPHVQRLVGDGGLGVVAASVRNRLESPPFRSLEVHVEALSLRRWFLFLGRAATPPNKHTL